MERWLCFVESDSQEPKYKHNFHQTYKDSKPEKKKIMNSPIIDRVGTKQKTNLMMLKSFALILASIAVASVIPITIPKVLAQQDIIPGIKVDKGPASLANFPGEKITQGLDGLRERLVEYRELGTLFTKWRAVIAIDERLPTRSCIDANANTLALFAALSQEAGLVPIVEPEILMNGSHTIIRCEEVTNAALESVFAALFQYRVVLELMLLKTGMILSGAESPQQAEVGEVAEVTLG